MSKNEDGNFIVSAEDKESFDTVQTFAYVHRALHTFRRALNQAGITNQFTWQWGNSPISVYPDKGVMENAYYDRQSKSLNFFHFQANGQTIYTCEAEDIVAHETGHAILDGLCPKYMESYLPQTGAMHEAFGDLASIMVLLSDLQTCEQVIISSKGDLLEKSLYLPDLANQFGNAIGQHGGLRNANNELSLSEVGNEVHAMSQVFTGAIYHILAYKAQISFDSEKESPAETLHRVAGELNTNLLKSFKANSHANASFAEIANSLSALESNPEVSAFIKKEFSRRGVDLSYKASMATLQEITDASFKKCGLTLRRPEISDLRRQAIVERRAELKALEERSAYNLTRLYS